MSFTLVVPEGDNASASFSVPLDLEHPHGGDDCLVRGHIGEGELEIYVKDTHPR
jgi:hypothetical protein